MFPFLFFPMPGSQYVPGIALIDTGVAEWIPAEERHAFGRPIGKFQNSRFKLAEMHTEITIGRTFVDQCIMEHNAGKLTAEKASMAKYWLSELLGRVVDQCLQLHGGLGYIADSPIAKMYTDARASRIYGGTNEIMREIIGRGMGF